jgi:hypothetical protein
MPPAINKELSVKKSLSIIISVCIILGLAAYIYWPKKKEPNNSISALVQMALQEEKPQSTTPTLVKPKILDTNPTNPISIDQCQSIFGENNTANQIEDKKRFEVTKFMAPLKQQKVTYAVAAIIGDIAGLSKEQAQAAYHGGNRYIDRSTDTDYMYFIRDKKTEHVKSTRNEFEILYMATKTKDYTSLTNAIAEKKLDPTHTLGVESLLANIISKNKDISPEQLQKIIDVGAPIEPDTVARAIQIKMPTETIINLAKGLTGDMNVSWKENDAATNFALASAKALRPELFNYFISQGVASTTENRAFGGLSILDVLPTPTNETEHAAALELAKYALNKGDRATKYSTKEKLEKWLPKDIAKQHEQQLQPEQALSPEVQAYSNQLKTLIADFDKQATQSQADILRCKEQHDYDSNTYFSELIDSKTNPETLSLATKKALQEFIKQEHAKNPNKILSAEMQRIFEALKEYPDKKALQDMFKRFGEPVKARNWVAAMAEVDAIAAQELFAGNGKLAYSLLINAYLNEKNPDPNYVQALIAKGAILDYTDVEQAVRRQNLDALKNLRSLGQDLNYIDGTGGNALTRAVSNYKDMSIINYLLENGVSTKPNTLGMDPLDIALSKLDSYRKRYEDPAVIQELERKADERKLLSSLIPSTTKTSYSSWALPPVIVEALIRAGAPIELSHIEKIEMLRVTNPDAYAKLEELIPNLANYLVKPKS